MRVSCYSHVLSLVLSVLSICVWALSFGPQMSFWSSGTDLKLLGTSTLRFAVVLRFPELGRRCIAGHSIILLSCWTKRVEPFIESRQSSILCAFELVDTVQEAIWTAPGWEERPRYVRTPVCTSPYRSSCFHRVLLILTSQHVTTSLNPSIVFVVLKLLNLRRHFGTCLGLGRDCPRVSISKRWHDFAKPR